MKKKVPTACFLFLVVDKSQIEKQINNVQKN